MPTLSWTPLAPGIWQLDIGESPAFTPRDAAKPIPRSGALANLGDQEPPIDAARIIAEPGARRTVAVLPLETDEVIWGLGLQFLSINQRSKARYLRVNSDPRHDTGETHAPVPFYVSSLGYAVLIDTARIPTVHISGCSRTSNPIKAQDRFVPNWNPTPASNTVEVAVNDTGLRIVLFAGPTPLEAVQRYNLFSGGGTLPPRWGLGYWHRVPLDADTAQTLAEAKEHRDRGFPCDVIGIEPGWQTHSYSCSYKWNDRFPDPKSMVQKLSKDGFQVNLWEHAYVSPASTINEALKPYSGSHTVWGGLVPEFTLDKACEIFADKHDQEHVSLGVSGYKLDECDGSELTSSSWMFPAQTAFPSGLDGEQMRQVFGLLQQKLMLELFRKHDRRTYGLVRASHAYAASFPFVLYTDLYDHRQFVRALCNSGFSGLLWSPEIRTGESPEDWARRFQACCFSPLLMLNAWCDRTKAWGHPTVAPIIKKYLELRMRLMPYLYSAFARYHFEGVPPVRPMQLGHAIPGVQGQAPTRAADGSDPQANLDSQFFFGDSMIVAPVFTGEKLRTVYLPPGNWYDFHTNEKIAGDQTITVYPGLDIIPIYVREGGIVPMMPVLQHAPKASDRVPLEIRCYGDIASRFDLYDDDGETFGYERGEYRWHTITLSPGPEARIKSPQDGWNSSYGEINFVHVV